MPPIAHRISIVLSDRSWILERLGLELQKRIEGVNLNDAADPSADINYYITFACRKAPVQTLEMGLFTHMEKTEELQELFVNTAKELDLSVCMSAKYRDHLVKCGVKNSILISPGVDHDRFQPKLRVGVVGRTYHTGRKGEALIAHLSNMEGIDWHFTGSGWPLPGSYLPDDSLPDFYRSMDYILVPALYEGGPMCVPEALAVGTPVIASDVGWVRQFPHVPFKNGDISDLRRVLEELLETKRALHKSTLKYTWDAYAEAHERAFHGLLKNVDRKTRIYRVSANPVFSEPVRLLLHGGEAVSKGGPSVRVPRTAEALKEIGVSAKFSNFGRADEIEEGIVHLFNVWNPTSALKAMRALKAAGKTVVFSPIFLDLNVRDFWQDALPHLLVDGPEELSVAYHKAKSHFAGRGRLSEILPGYHAMIREMIELADHIVFLSNTERRSLEAIGARVDDARASLVLNPVDLELWQGGDPALFRDTWLREFGEPEDYILCIGRIEARKNQLALAKAIVGLPLRLVLIGHVGDQGYVNKIREVSGTQLVITGRLDHGGEMMRSALAGAKAFVLASWAEGASLAALEAAAAGSNIVLSDLSSEREYFGDLATYCDPGNLGSVRAAIESAISIRNVKSRGRRLRERVKKNNSWARYAEETAKAYIIAQKNGPKPRVKRDILAYRISPKLVLDITTLAHHRGRMTGICRVEALLAQEFLTSDAKPRFICWNDKLKRFIEVPTAYSRFGKASQYREYLDDKPDAPSAELDSDCSVVVPGSAWMQNRRYVRGLEDLKSATRCSIISIIYDLVPFKFPFWFDKNYAPVFESNFYRLAAISNHILTDSKSCATDVKQVLTAAGINDLAIDPIRLGDPTLASPEPGKDTNTESSLKAAFAQMKFVLAVGAVHTRKNYELLYRVWARFADEGILPDLHLVIVGGIAWNGQSLADRIAGDTRVNRNIHILSDIDDADLAWLYDSCQFTVFPSHYEGWGLPVAESLVRGKLCLATNASSVPEIAPDFVEHIDPEDFTTWKTKIAFYANSAAAREMREAAIRNGYEQVHWSTTVRDIVSVLSKPRLERGFHELLLGELAKADFNAPPMTLGFCSGWHPAESWGRWAGANRVHITLNASGAKRQVQDRFRVLLSLKGFIPSGRKKVFSIESSGGDTLFSCNVTNKSFPENVIVTLPTSEINQNGLLTLRMSFQTDAEKPNQYGSRQLGVGLISAKLLHPELSNPLHSLSRSEVWIDGSVPTSIDLLDASHRAICAPGLDVTNAWGACARDVAYELFLPVLPGAPTQDLTITLRPVASSDAPVHLRVSCNGTILTETLFHSDVPTEVTVRIAAAIFEIAAPAVLRLECDSLQSPKDIDIGSTSTISGVGLFDLTLTPSEMEG